MTMILNIDGSRTCVLMAQDLLSVPPPLTPLWEHQIFDAVRKGGGPAKKHMLFKKKKYGLVLEGGGERRRIRHSCYE